MRRILCWIGLHKVTEYEEILCFQYGDCDHCGKSVGRLAPWLFEEMERQRGW